MPFELFMEVLISHLGSKNKETCHCVTGAANHWQRLEFGEVKLTVHQ